MNILVTENVKYFWGYATEKDPKAFESESCIVSWSLHSIILWGEEVVISQQMVWMRAQDSRVYAVGWFLNFYLFSLPLDLFEFPSE